MNHVLDHTGCEYVPVNSGDAFDNVFFFAPNVSSDVIECFNHALGENQPDITALLQVHLFMYSR